MILKTITKAALLLAVLGGAAHGADEASKKDSLWAGFTNPPAAYRALPMEGARAVTSPVERVEKLAQGRWGGLHGSVLGVLQCLTPVFFERCRAGGLRAIRKTTAYSGQRV